ncbi:hypothetical protein [Spirosoma foliorum]|uniref:Uncharacterized protein n=1 Tax=Spirosoma foliorum TaxID=2710596 RepID=A0A7G5GNZ0_9BACT|nr:hypothetical protein [Spirosoma foliorum]QMW00582.1 hypothetical protein H3H32_21580 [Spirosoma foliorum]
MKNVSLFLFASFLSISVQSFSQTTASASTTPTIVVSSTDFFAGKWEITITGTPSGDTKMVTDLVRKDGKLTGELKDPTGTRPAMPLSKVDEEKDKITLYFNSDQAGEIPVELTKVDDDHLKGQLMNMFDATALRVKK